MLLCTKIRLEVSEEDAATLDFMQGKCRGLYNWWVGRLRDGEKWRFADCKRTLAESRIHDPELDDVYGKLLAEVYYRLDKAMKAFFRRIKAGETPGFPRFKPRHCFFTLCYPAMYLKIEGDKLILPTGGRGEHKRFPNVVARLTEEAPTNFKEVAISRDARGNYSASFVSEHLEQPTTDTGVIAFDLGIKTLATGVNEQGKVYKRVSEMCHICGRKQAMPLYKRMYRCENCGLVMGRDENSARNILVRFLARLEPHTGDPVRCADVFTAIDYV
jgi:putative transposase